MPAVTRVASGLPLEPMAWSSMVALAALWVPDTSGSGRPETQRASDFMFPHVFGFLLAVAVGRCLFLPRQGPRRSMRQLLWTAPLAWTSHAYLWRHPVPGVVNTLAPIGQYDAQGLFMSVLLLPLLCMALGLHLELELEQATFEHNLWDMYALVTLLSAWLLWELHGLSQATKDQCRFAVQFVSMVAVSTMWWAHRIPDAIVPDVLKQRKVKSFLVMARTVVGFLPLWNLLFDAIVLVVPPSFYGAWTMGEWSVVTNLMAMALIHYVLYNMSFGPVRPPPHPGTVATSGIMATLVTCFALSRLNAWRLNRLQRRNNNNNNIQKDHPDKLLWLSAIQLPLMVILPLVGVELDMLYLRAPLVPKVVPLPTLDTTRNSNTSSGPWAEFNSMQDLPTCLQWLRNFLLEKEPPPDGLPRWLLDATDVPRCKWLQYWGAVLFVGLFLAPHGRRARNIVLARKWFHGMAVLLFAPVTIVAPQLMSLAYAVAMSGLLLVELVRTDIPLIHELFFRPYLDPAKDHPQRLVLSHLALIGGCAVPLWLAELVYNDVVTGGVMHQPVSPVGLAAGTTVFGAAHIWITRGRRLLPLWGVLSLGIGDSAGAVVGTCYGKHRWQPGTPNRKTMEGSFAMWITLMASCLALEYFVTSDYVMMEEAAEWKETAGPLWSFEINCFIVVTIVTLLEAVTYQLDNLVLPLVGSTLWLFLNR